MLIAIVISAQGETVTQEFPTGEKVSVAGHEFVYEGQVFYENERQQTLRQALSGGFSSISLVTGPEGGFTPEEVAEAEAAGMTVCSLGTRILRCETAPLCALTAAMYAAGEL